MLEGSASIVIRIDDVNQGAVKSSKPSASIAPHPGERRKRVDRRIARAAFDGPDRRTGRDRRQLRFLRLLSEISKTLVDVLPLQQVLSRVVDLVFEWLVRDFSTLALDLHGKASSTPEQQQWVLETIRKPVIDAARDEAIYAEVRALAGAYVMPE